MSPSPPLALLLLLGCGLPSLIQGVPQIDMSGLVGETVHLPCRVDTENCGLLHSIKWYRGSSRIFVFSEMSKISHAEGDYNERAFLHYAPNATESTLEVRELQVADEAVYKCEITYIEVRDGCSVVQFVNLTTLIKPEYVRVRRGDGGDVADGTSIGPFNEGDELTLECESGGGKPIPAVHWYNGTHKMNGQYEWESGANSVGTGRNRIRVTLGRGDLGARYECRADSAALDKPITSTTHVLVHVRPLRLKLSGVEKYAVEGSIVTLKCEVFNALPSANISWFNGTTPYSELEVDPETNFIRNMYKTHPPTIRYQEEEDQTVTTVSELRFTARTFDNDVTLRCEGINAVMKAKDEKPLREAINMEVLYPPIVQIASKSEDLANVTVNETEHVALFCDFDANPKKIDSVKWLRDGVQLQTNSDHYEAAADDTGLLIRNATRYDQGEYTCAVTNNVGEGISRNSINVIVYYKPQVRVHMSPPSPVLELEAPNVTLTCEVEQGNPPTLLAVVWNLGGEVLKELPECDNGSATTFCDVDPSRLMLENVQRAFHGNYSCVGKNEAGWGLSSPEEELVVFYPPGPARLVFEPARVVKKHNVTLSCSVNDTGRPETSVFRWMRGSHQLHEVTSSSWTIDPVILETQANYTCYAVNEGGDGEPASVYINVSAPPLFIDRLPPYYGALYTNQYINVSCRVECSPACGVHWLKNGVPLATGPDSRYSVIEELLGPDVRTSDFESIKSTLVWNMSAWEGGQLDRVHDSANYTCQSSENAVGAGVQSTTLFDVEYPPENISVSNQVVNVVENNIPGKVLCYAKGYPNASYYWIQVGPPSKVVSKDNILHLNEQVTRHQSGNYTCKAHNKHGSIEKNITINVQYKPECGISQSESDGKLVLTCTATANPPGVDFVWHIKGENESIEENVYKKGHQSQLILESYVENFRTYICVANNSIGFSVQCERDVTGHVISWWKNFENDNYKIIIAVIVAAILMVVIVCITIIVVCRRKRADDKYNNPLELEERENPDGDSNLQPPPPPPPPPMQTAQQPARPMHKWPLRPGVLVHVNGAHSLNLGRSESSSPSSPQTINPPLTLPSKGRAKLTARKVKQRRSVGLISDSIDDTNQHSRANKIRQMFLNESSKYRCEAMPGVFHGKSGVVTFKKLDAPSNSGVSRKRKKPGSGPSPLATKDKSKQDLASSPSDGLLQPDGDKAFYENLPFHGMQSAPNKPATLCSNAQASQSSRPPSQLSQYGSSGYGSTRSHMGPHLQKSQTVALTSKDKFNSLRLHPHKKHFPQFYSMRLHYRYRNRGGSRKSQDKQQGNNMPLSPITSQNYVNDTQSEPQEANSSESEVNNNAGSSPVRVQPPVPAPRKQSKSVVHTYQNVPPPVIPKPADTQESLTQSQPPPSATQQHHHHFNLTPSHPLLMPPPADHHHHHHHNRHSPSAAAAVAGLQPQQFGSARRRHHANSRTYLPPMRLEYQQPYYMADPSYVPESVVYADLALAGGGGVSGRRSGGANGDPNQLPPHYRSSSQVPTEYAILKFHDVGQEIDV